MVINKAHLNKHNLCTCSLKQASNSSQNTLNFVPLNPLFVRKSNIIERSAKLSINRNLSSTSREIVFEVTEASPVRSK